MFKVDLDALWKELIDNFFEEFIIFFASDILEDVDLTKGYEFLDKELNKIMPKNQSKKRRADKLVKVYLKDGEEKWVLVHIEVQGYKEKEFAERMFRYFYRIYDKFDKKIFAIALFTDENKEYKPMEYRYSFFDTILTYEFRAYKIIEQDENLLMNSQNPFGLAIAAALAGIRNKKDVDKKYDFKVKLSRLLLQRNWNKDKIRKLMIFIDIILALPKDLELKYEEQFESKNERGEELMGLEFKDSNLAYAYKQKGIEEGKQKGLEEGKQKGLEEGIEKGIEKNLIQTTKTLIKRKFKLDIMTTQMEALIDNAKIESLEEFLRLIFDFEKLEDVTEYLLKNAKETK